MTSSKSFNLCGTLKRKKNTVRIWKKKLMVEMQKEFFDVVTTAAMDYNFNF
jgi:hypothetical protein